MKPPIPVAEHDTVQSKYMSSNPPIRIVKHVIRPTFPSSNSTNTVAVHSTPSAPSASTVKTSTASIQSTISRIQPTSISSKSTISIQNSLENSKVNSAKIVESQTIKGSGKTEGTVPTVANDGKKIKILSDVSLNDAKAKLLEIDKISSKNLKLTNVIKGTDESPSQTAVHTSSSITKPIMSLCSTSVPLKGKIDKINSKNLKFINVIKGTQESPSQSTVTSNSAASLCSTSTHTDIKSKNLKFTIIKKTETRPSQAAILLSTSTSRPTIPMCSSSVPLKAKIDNTLPQKLKLTSKQTEESSLQSVIYISDSSSRPTVPFCFKAIPKQAIQAKDDQTKSKNLKFINVVKGAESLKSAVQISSPSSKPSTSLYTTSASTTSEIDDNLSKNLKFTNVIKGTVQSSEQSAIHMSNSKGIMPKCSTSAPFKAVSDNMPFPTSDQPIEMLMPAKQKQITKRHRSSEPCPIDDKTTYHDVLWATNSPRTYERNNVKRLLSAKIMEKSRIPDESVVQSIPSKIENEEAISRGDIKCEDQCEVMPVKNLKLLLKSKPISNHQTPLTSTTVPTADNFVKEPSKTNSVSATRRTFNGFSNDDIVASATVLDRINSVVTKSRLKEATFIDYTALDVAHESELQNVECDNEHWVLNCETGVLEKNINEDKEEELSLKGDLSFKSNPVHESNPIKQSSPITTISEHNVLNISSKSSPKTLKDNNSTIDDISISPSKTFVTEDADDETSDIDLVDRSKTKCTGGTTTPAVKNRRAILKSIELHRKAFNPATTDEESEISLCVRPPRPKLRKYRHKQTVEQLKNQQNAHVSLLKRFNRGDSDCDVWDIEALSYFANSVMNRIELLESQVKCCFDQHKHKESNVENNSLLEQSLMNANIENSETVNPSECSINMNSQLNFGVACKSPLPQSTKQDLPDNTENVEGK